MGAPICGAAMPLPFPNLDCQSRSVSLRSSATTRTPVERGLRTDEHFILRAGSPSRRIRCTVTQVNLRTRDDGSHHSCGWTLRPYGVTEGAPCLSGFDLLGK